MKIPTERLLLRPFQETDLDEFLSQLENDEFEGLKAIRASRGRTVSSI